jgi:hypothetical protein
VGKDLPILFSRVNVIAAGKTIIFRPVILHRQTRDASKSPSTTYFVCFLAGPELEIILVH